jgi:acyl-CoA reductase-like NAD-dependent aldehyde dehydrogenase
VQQGRVLEHIERSRADGATVISGGASPDDDELRHGCFVEPTIIRAGPGTALWRDEVFGPVVAVVEARDFDEAVLLANDSAYGLSAAIFTRDLGRAHAFIERAEAGQVAVNLPTSGWDVHHPFGGFKDSGSPFKEQGEAGLAFYTRWKTSAVRWRV